MVIPSIVIRPDIRTISGSRGNNDELTSFLFYLVKHNETLPFFNKNTIKEEKKL